MSTDSPKPTYQDAQIVRITTKKVRGKSTLIHDGIGLNWEGVAGDFNPNPN